MDFLLNLASNGVSEVGDFSDAALAINRVALGVFFALSGFHKIFHRGRHETMVKTLIETKVPFLRFNAWFVPTVELLAGASLALGILSAFSALLLGAICLVAACTDGIKRVKEWKPLNFGDLLDDILYLPEVLLGFMVVVVVFVGPGAWRLV